MLVTIHKAKRQTGHGHWSVRIGNHVEYEEITKQEARRHQADINRYLSVFIKESGIESAAKEAALVGERIRKAIDK